jgi:type II secretory pathway pseudopilin PulG
MSIQRHTGKQSETGGEAGYMLLAVVVMVALVLIALSVAAPVVARDLRRDKEVESEHRAEQYVRAIRLYYKKTHAYPPSMEALEKTNNVRYLRQKYVDPLTGKSDWRIIHQPKTKTHFPFGQELSGMTAGLGSAAGLQSPGLGGVGTVGTSTNQGCSGANSAFCNQAVTTSTSGGAAGATGSPGASGSSGSTGSSSDTGMFGDSSGGVIYGVATSRSGDSILNPNQQTTYETWEFWYDPLIELLYAKGVVTGGGGVGSQSASSFGQNAVTGQPNGPSGATGSTGPTGLPGSTGTTFP